MEYITIIFSIIVSASLITTYYLTKDNKMFTDKVGDVIKKPWGEYEILHQGQNYQVKRIQINPGHRTSLQSHQHRKEIWTVVEGQLFVTQDDQKYTLRPGQKTTINKRQKHRASNEQTNHATTFIEIQCGNYLKENDIVRYEDDYNRG